jgi:glycosyltransferase A (GT-A) superfamily protein (DUF2064 family)
LQRHVVVFARQPRLGTVKRRLARSIGDGAALAFYRATLAILVRRLGDDPRWRLHVAWTPQSARLFPRISALVQAPGDLGHRMAQFLDPHGPLPAGPTVIIGSDVPTLEAPHVWRAFRALGSADFVFGPAPDGGYWLVGAARRRAMPHGLFRNVRWSSADALNDSLASLPRGTARLLADRLDDVDDGDAYMRWRAGRRA